MLDGLWQTSTVCGHEARVYEPNFGCKSQNKRTNMSSGGGSLSPELKWIEDTGTKLQTDVTTENNTWTERIKNKSKSNPLVPIGMLATTACLCMGLTHFKSGDSVKQQKYMRGRILFQAFSFVTMVGGVLSLHFQSKGSSGAQK